MAIIELVARIFLSTIFIAAAPRHFTAAAIAHAAELGVPLARIAVPLSGALAIVGGASVLVGFHARWGALALVAFLVPVTFGMHAFWRLSDPVAVHVQQAMFVKNVAILGGVLLVAIHGAGAIAFD
ncbi:MAG TPA: DoxX family protein [Kofleriaceae bacterium]|nr:DoxX family protein [Kofleriaceae bacterium]